MELMRNVLLATAGHVDHGKTTLIKRLTGIDTDRLKEEKERGLSIDIGFAYLDFPGDNLRIEFIDVPGHERFIKNAIVGLVSAQGILLVVDAYEGIKPQTIQHLKVAETLGIRKGVVVLTKIDKVDEYSLRVREEEVGGLLKEFTLEMDIVKVSAPTGKGIEDLKEALRKLSLSIDNSELGKRPLRVFIDSSFSVKGFGTVIRGSCVEGTLKERSVVSIEPLGVQSRVRKMQNQGKWVREVKAVQRVAVNLPDIDHKNVRRGFWLLKPDSYVKGNKVIIQTDFPLKNGGVYYVFFGMKEIECRVRSIDTGTYLLSLRNEAVSKRGDRVIILDSSAKLVDGASVLHPCVMNQSRAFIKANLEELNSNFELYLLREKGKQGLNPKLYYKLTGAEFLKEKIEDVAIFRGGKFYLREKLPDNASMQRLSTASEQEMEKLIKLLEEGIKSYEDINLPADIVNEACKKGLVHRIGSNMLVSDERLREYISLLREIGESFSLQEAKGKLGLSRRKLIALLEYLDGAGYTLRRGERRLWRKVIGRG